MVDYSPEVATEADVRNFTTPPLDYDDVSQAELLLKLKIVEQWAKYKYFAGGALPTAAGLPVVLITVTSLLSNPSLAKKHYTLASESIGDYKYSLGISPGAMKGGYISPLNDVKTWTMIAEEILENLRTSRVKVRVVNG